MRDHQPSQWPELFGTPENLCVCGGTIEHGRCDRQERLLAELIASAPGVNYVNAQSQELAAKTLNPLKTIDEDGLIKPALDVDVLSITRDIARG